MLSAASKIIKHSWDWKGDNMFTCSNEPESVLSWCMICSMADFTLLKFIEKYLLFWSSDHRTLWLKNHAEYVCCQRPSKTSLLFKFSCLFTHKINYFQNYKHTKPNNNIMLAKRKIKIWYQALMGGCRKIKYTIKWLLINRLSFLGIWSENVISLYCWNSKMHLCWKLISPKFKTKSGLNTRTHHFSSKKL